MQQQQGYARTDIDAHAEEFHARGFTVVRGAIGADYADRLRAEVERVFAGPEDGYGPIVRTKMFEQGEIFENLLEQQPVLQIAQAILGANIHMFAMNALKTPPGTGISNWHVDDELFMPIPEGVELDSRMQVPVHMLTCIYYLVDVDEAMGPTQLVPGSHRSGSHPDRRQAPPIYKGQGPVSITAQKGDCLLFDGQTWHRGAPNESDKPRIVQQVCYSKRWVAQRFYPFIDYRMPQEVVDRARNNPQRLKLLGFHDRGAYG